MARKAATEGHGVPAAVDEATLAPITGMLSSRLIVLANLLRRGALLRYQRLAGLSSVEFGLVAVLGRHPPMSVARLAAAVGMDKGQISRALTGLVRRKLVAKVVNVRDSREVLVSLTRTGLAAHDRIVEGAIERQRQLLEGMDSAWTQRLLEDLDRLTAKAADMLDEERRRSP
ncbi:MAG: MarR family winged helix-turn-helix transcriptional regulator [Xanthobacteraceae bacterium]